ncbi:MAG: MFS transporter [Clostridia bacterium]|nr:MFS transporter [Clostridia bacterium]
MSTPNYRRTRFACYFAYVAAASVFALPAMLFTTFHRLYGVSFTLLGTLVVVNFCVQMCVDLIFTFFSKHFNIQLTVRVMPLLTAVGLLIYALTPHLFPQYAYLGLVVGTVIFSLAAGLGEVLISPLVAAIPSEHPDKDMSMLHSLYGWGVVGVVLISSLYFHLFGTDNWLYLALFWATLPVMSSLLFCISDLPDLQLSSGDRGQKTAGRAKGIALCLLCIFLGSSAENTMTNWISGYMEVALQIPKEVGDMLGLAVFALLLALTRVWYARYAPDITKTLLVSMIGATVCYLAVGLVGQVYVAFAGCILTGIFTSMLWPGTLILMEEKIPSPGVAAYALMAAGGDFGASVAPQMMGILVDRVSASPFAAQLSASMGATPEEIGMKVGMLVSTLFPALGVALVLYIRRVYKKR